MIVLVGASGGIGKEIVGHLASLDSVVATYNSHKLKLSSKRIKQIKLNLLSKKEVDAFAVSLARSKQKITFINLAALSPDNLLVQTTDAVWERTFRINVHSTLSILRHILPKMVQDKWGRVILTSSVVAENGVVGAGAYSSSKSALLGLNKTIALEYGRFHITSNLLTLGYFDKGLIETLPANAKTEILQRISCRKFGSVKDIFEAIRFILKTEYLNGSVIRLDGGLT